jgi:DNA-binding transcriptional regulator GbsR (MarR family)
MEDATKLFDEMENFIMDSISDYMEFVGAQTTMGRVFGLLLTKSEPMSLSQITLKLGLSKPAISTALKQGAQINLFKKVYNPEAPREDFYSMTENFIELMLDPGLSKLGMLNEKIKDAVKKLDKKKEIVDDNEELTKLHKKLQYHYMTFEILIEEYEDLCTRLRTRIKDLKKQHKDLL